MELSNLTPELTGEQLTKKIKGLLIASPVKWVVRRGLALD
jgi:hypothetical protein